MYVFTLYSHYRELINTDKTLNKDLLFPNIIMHQAEKAFCRQWSGKRLLWQDGIRL